MSAKKNTIICSIDEFNSILEDLDYAKVAYSLMNNACYVEAETAGNIFYVSLTGETEDIEPIGTIASAFYKKCNIHDIRDKYGYTEYITSLNKKKIKWDYEVASGYQYYDEHFVLKPLKCWGYDINSAFPFAMLSPMPDTRQTPRYNDIIKKGEIGFYKSGGATTDEGDWAEIIFPLMDSPFKKYVYDLYEMKKITTGKEKDKYKKKLNFATGLIARRNIFLRNALIYYSNKYIKKYIDDDTVYCNVDCIVSLKPRYDLPIGDEIGMFKEEHTCEYFKYKKSAIYQWSNDCRYAGIPRGFITDIEDIENWADNLPYKFVNGRIVKNEK